MLLLRIDGIETVATQGKTLLDLIRELKMDTRTLSSRPLAAKIAGEVFTLNYVPVRTLFLLQTSQKMMQKEFFRKMQVPLQCTSYLLLQFRNR